MQAIGILGLTAGMFIFIVAGIVWAAIVTIVIEWVKEKMI